MDAGTPKCFNQEKWQVRDDGLVFVDYTIQALDHLLHRSYWTRT